MNSFDRVLVADDHEVVRKLLKDTLTREGYTVDACGDGLAALKALERGGYSLLITDLEMPGRNGIELIRDLRARGNRIPIVLMSGSLGHLVEKTSADSDLVEFLAKPFGVDELRAAIQTLTESRRE